MSAIELLQTEIAQLRAEVERLQDFEDNYETLTRLLHNRFRMKDGVMPDYKVEDVLVENTQLRARVAELVAAMYEAIREARTLECNTDPLVDHILQPAINAAKGQP